MECELPAEFPALAADRDFVALIRSVDGDVNCEQLRGLLRSPLTPSGGPLSAESADSVYVKAMRQRLPGVPGDLLASAATFWQLVGGIADAEAWWDAGISPLDQRTLDYLAAGLEPSDVARHLGPYTVLEHLRRGSSAAWCAARMRRDNVA